MREKKADDRLFAPGTPVEVTFGCYQGEQGVVVDAAWPLPGVFVDLPKRNVAYYALRHLKIIEDGKEKK